MPILYYDEIAGEFYDEAENEVGVKYEDAIMVGNVSVKKGYFDNGRGHHFLMKVEGDKKDIKAFSKAFMLQIDIGEENIDLTTCVQENIKKLKREQLKRERQLNRECEDKKQLWSASEWHDFDKLVKAIGDAGWSMASKSENEVRFEYIAASNDDFNLTLVFIVDNSKTIVDDLWLIGMTGWRPKDGSFGGGTFGNWSGCESNPYIRDLELINKFDGIPTPKQAVESLMNFANESDHISRYIAGYNFH